MLTMRTTKCCEFQADVPFSFSTTQRYKKHKNRLFDQNLAAVLCGPGNVDGWYKSLFSFRFLYSWFF